MDERPKVPSGLLAKFRGIGQARLERLGAAMLELEKNPGHAQIAEEAMRESDWSSDGALPI